MNLGMKPSNSNTFLHICVSIHPLHSDTVTHKLCCGTRSKELHVSKSLQASSTKVQHETYSKGWWFDLVDLDDLSKDRDDNINEI